MTITVDPRKSGIFSLAHVDASYYGAHPSASGATNAAAIQAALDLGGNVSVSAPGVYTVSKTLHIPSHTGLYTAPNVFLKLSDGSFPLIINKYSQIAFAGSQVVVGSGKVTFTEKGHTRIVGQKMYCENALGNTSINGVQTITEVTSTSWSIVPSDVTTAVTNTTANRLYAGPYFPLAGSNFVRASNVVTVTETSHVRQIGDHVYIAGLGGTNSFNGMAEITTVSPGVSWTYANTGANETATGTAQLLGDTGIQLLNFQYDGNRATADGDQWHNFSCRFVNIGNSFFDIAYVRESRYRGLTLYNSGYCEIPRVVVDHGAVALELESNCNHTRIGRLVGSNLTDDVFAVGVVDNVTGPFGDTACPSGKGNCDHTFIDSITGDSSTGLCKLFCFTGFDIGSVRILKLTGRGRGVAGDTSVGVSGGTMRELVIDQFDASPIAAGEHGIVFAGISSYGSVTINNIRDNYSNNASTFLFNISTTVGRLTLNNLVSETYTTSFSPIQLSSGSVRVFTINNSRLTAGSGGSVMNIASGATVTNLIFNNVEFSGAGTSGSANYFGNMLTLSAGGTLRRLIANNVELTTGQGNAVFQLGGNTQTVECDISNIGNIGSGSNDGKMAAILIDNASSTSGNVRFNNMRFATGPANNIFQLAGSGTWSIKGSGLHLPVANKFALLTSGTVNVSIDCREAQIDMGANAGAPPARLVPVQGDQLYNTNATGPGVYERIGAAWVKL